MSRHRLARAVPAHRSSGWDLARRHLIDGAAYYSIDGRIKDVINRGVEKIHAEEVEELLMRHPAIANAALVAMPD